MVPESLKVLEDLNRWVISHHYVREASIVGYRIHKEVFKKTRAQKQSEYTQASFDDLNDALTFLADSDYPIQLSLYEVESWLVWIPAVSIIYSMPASLQLPLFNLVLCFFVILLTVLSKEK